MASVVRRFGLRGIAFFYLAAILLGPLAIVFYRTFENGYDAAWDALSSPETVQRVQADADHHGDRRAREHGLRDRLRARDRAAQVPGQGARERLRRPAARPLAGRRRAVALPALRPRRLVRRLAHRPRRPGAVRAPVDGDRDDLRLAAVRRPRGRADAARDRRRAGAGRADARRLVLADVLADHAARDPLGRHLRRHPDDGPLPRRVRRRRRRLGPAPG